MKTATGLVKISLAASVVAGMVACAQFQEASPSDRVSSHAVAASDAATPAASVDPCQAEELDADEFIPLAQNDPLSCFGDRSLTVYGYVSQMGGVGSCTEQLVPGDGWLDLCAGPQRILVRDLEDEDGMTIFLGRTLEPSSIPHGSVVAIRGHFDDPAAATCAIESDNDPERLAAIRESCRQAFIVEEVDLTP